MSENGSAYSSTYYLLTVKTSTSPNEIDVTIWIFEKVSKCQVSTWRECSGQLLKVKPSEPCNEPWNTATWWFGILGMSAQLLKMFCWLCQLAARDLSWITSCNRLTIRRFLPFQLKTKCKFQPWQHLAKGKWDFTSCTLGNLIAGTETLKFEKFVNRWRQPVEIFFPPKRKWFKVGSVWRLTGQQSEPIGSVISVCN